MNEGVVMSSTKIIAGAYGFACDEDNRAGLFNIAIRSNLVVDISEDLEGLRRKYPEAEIVDASEKIVFPTLFNFITISFQNSSSPKTLRMFLGSSTFFGSCSSSV